MLQVLNGPTIEEGESLSDGVDCSGGQLVRITMPTEWGEDAPLTFEFSTDGLMYNDMFDLKGFAVTIEHVVPGSGVIIPADIGQAIAFIKFRSGTRGNPIVQNERRQFAVTIVAAESAPVQTSRKKTPVKRSAKKGKRR
jgi:hypothetical protein